MGKSALFNRIVGRGAAIVYDRPGVTRDRLYVRAQWGRREFVLVDTGGLMATAAAMRGAESADALMQEISADNLPFAIERQAAAGVAEADVILMVCDGQEGPTASDEEIIAWLRREHAHRPIVFAINKCESQLEGDLLAAQFWSYGLQPIAVSAKSGTGSGDMLDAVVQVRAALLICLMQASWQHSCGHACMAGARVVLLGCTSRNVVPSAQCQACQSLQRAALAHARLPCVCPAGGSSTGAPAARLCAATARRAS